MTDLLRKTKVILGITDDSQDELLTTYLDIAEQAVLAKLYPFDLDQMIVPARYNNIICEIAVYFYGKQGAEGQTRHDEQGISRTYESSDIPPSLLRKIVPYGRAL